MQSARLIMRRKKSQYGFKLMASVLLLAATHIAGAQDNSPYSRYGLGDMVPNTNVVNRGMGGVSAGYADVLSINFNNPASYSSFKSYLEEKSKKPVSGRALLDVGINISSRTLRNPNQTESFTSSNLIFNYIQLGVPLRNNWGLSFGLRPLTRIGYKVDRREQLLDPNDGHLIDSALTRFTGSGGAFLPTIGTGFAIGNLSLGANMGYLFGKKEYITNRTFLNDTVLYHSAADSVRTSFGDLFFMAGVQYKINFNKHTLLRLGVSGNIKQTINATQDESVYISSPNGPSDSVYSQQNIKGEIIYPTSYTAGFMLEHMNDNLSGWSFGADYVQNKWSEYRFFGHTDSVQDNWELRVGGQIRPKPGTNYFSNVAYRAGFYLGPDYIKIGQKLPQFGITFGMALPIASYSQLSRGQYTLLNVGLEYGKRGNNDNILKENLFRLSLGFNFSDIWFSKRKYD